MERVAFILPALNEEAAIESTLAGLLAAPPRDAVRGQIIVVDNGSTDATAGRARACGATVIAEPRRGYGRACLAGLAALDQGTTIVVFLDADGSDDPADLPQLLQPLARDEADLVLGSRVLGERERGALTPQQRFGNWLATTLIRILYGVRYTDLGPFRAIRRSALARLNMRDTDFGWTVEMQINAARQGLRVREIPVRYRRRRHGKSKISGTLRGTLAAGCKILWTIARYARAR